MAELRVRTIDEADLDTVLSEDFSFDGDLEFDDALLVKGRLSGSIRSETNLYVGVDARVDAKIHAARVSIKGRVTGDVVASERIELFAGAHISGNVTTPDLIVQSGSFFNGTIRMERHLPGQDTDDSQGEESTPS